MTKILLVEDDKSLREIYGVRLLAEGYDIVSAGDGEEALAMAIKDRPDLIVSDVMMPKISGFDMLDILRSTTETKNIKVIMMTALSSEEQRQRGVNLGADRYLVKSQVGIEDVVRTVHEVLADAPVTGHAPLIATPPQQPATVPVPNVTPAAPAVAPLPVPTPVHSGAIPMPVPAAASVVTPAPAPVTLPTPVVPTPVAAPTPEPIATPVPVSTPAASAPSPTPVSQPTDTASTQLTTSTLPQPSAPFSTPRPGTLADRVIQPLESSGTPAPDFAHLINQELSSETPATFPGASPAPVATPPNLNFEETPRPAVPATGIGTSNLPPPPAPNTGI